MRLKIKEVQGKRKKPLKLKKWLYPLSPERQYTKDLYELTAKLRELIYKYLFPQLTSLVNQANASSPEQPRSDDFLSDLFRTFNYIREAIQPSMLNTESDAIKISREINYFNKVQFEKVTSSLLSIDLFFDEPWLTDQLSLFATQNAELITSLVDDEIQRVSGIVQRGFQQGLPQTTIAEQIEQTFGIARRHAKLIARDQTTKLNSSLTKLRQEELGIETYTWQTSGDERVRPSHRLMDGLICRWDDPSLYKHEGETRWKKRTNSMPDNHVGGDVQCRCVALPNIEDFADV